MDLFFENPKYGGSVANDESPIQLEPIQESDKAQEASYAVSEIIGKNVNSHIIFEKVILSAWWEMMRIVFGETDMVIQNVFEHVAIVVKGISPVSWTELVFKGISGSLYTIGMGPSFRILKSVAMVNGEGPLLRTLDVPQFSPHLQEPVPNSPNVPYDICSCPFLFHQFLLLRSHSLFEGQ
ncbi:hypothetical protein RF11_01745 [Thelohanellus kitauei]|uniref:Uncharacterized protein n=1 Tax=Thelohanellus kitauei TaxID=669202 RepID=A0A0C2I763_THEKT|nr:hypothetical protein RF11_01745 [Thelohanellus kitauei]